MSDKPATSSGDYSSTQARKNREYLAEWKKWFDSLSPEKQARLKEKGLDRPRIDEFVVHNGSSDAADRREASHNPDVIGEIEPTPDNSLPHATCDDLSHFIAWALDDKHPALKLWAAAFATGMEITQGVSQAAKARELGVERATLSKRVKLLEKEFGFRSRNMKSLSACEKYRTDKRTNHHRYQNIIAGARQAAGTICDDKLD